MKTETIILLATAVAQLATVFLIYWQVEAHRLDRFLEDAAAKNSERRKLFMAYCELDDSSATPRNERFKQLLDQSDDLREICEENIRLISRVGARLPMLPSLRATALHWHVVVLLWELLGPYVMERRREVGPTYAESFLSYAKESIDSMLQQERQFWTIIDPDRRRKRDVRLTRSHIRSMREHIDATLRLHNSVVL